MDAQSPTVPRAPGRAAVLAATAAAVIAAAAAVWLTWKLAAVERELARVAAQAEHIDARTALIRLEGKSAGRGIGAIIEQIDFWAPQLATSATPHPAAVKIEEALDECLEAVDALGEEAWPRLLAALESPTARDDETRKWLLRAAVRARPGEGKALLASVMRGTRLAPTSRLRFFATDELLAMDKPFAGEVLAQILEVESVRGVTRQVPPGLAPEYERAIGTNAIADFWNFIPRLVQSGHPDTENILRMILGRPEHDRMTYQECIQQLGHLGSRAAVPRIKELYAAPPRNEFNPIFLSICVQAIADIEGSRACDWFREQLRTTSIPMVVTRLQDVLKQHCGGQAPPPPPEKPR